MDASLHQMEHLIPDRGQVQLMGNVELSTVVDPISVPVHLQSGYPQTVYIPCNQTTLKQSTSHAARLPSNSPQMWPFAEQLPHFNASRLLHNLKREPCD